MNTLQQQKTLLFLFLTTQTTFYAQETHHFRCSQHARMQVIRVGEEPSGIKKQKTKDDFAKTSAVATQIMLTGEDLLKHGNNLEKLEIALSFFKRLNWDLGPRRVKHLQSYSKWTQEGLRNPNIIENLRVPYFQNIIDAQVLAGRAEQLLKED